MTVLYFEDLAAGQSYGSAEFVVEAWAISAFAAEYDPQPFHLNDAAARGSLFGRLAASGWHTAAMTMRLLVAGAFRPAGGIIGIGGELQWPAPVHPGDTLSVTAEIVETRLSRSRPAHGLVTVRVTTRNQAGATVQVFTPTLLVERRAVGQTDAERVEGIEPAS